MKTNLSILKGIAKKLTVSLAFAGLTVCAFATLGESNFGKEKPKRSTSLLSNKKQTFTGTISLQSGYSFRGSQVINPNQSAINLSNTIVTYQQGNVTYTIPASKKVILNNKITFNPNAKTRN